MKAAYEDLREYTRGLRVIDTHEHLPAWEKRCETDADILREYLTQYFSCDLISAGLAPQDLEKVRDVKRPLMERWKLVESHWEHARFTGYGRALDKAVQTLYGLPCICADTLEEANTRFRKALEGGNRYEDVLKTRANIHTVILDGWTMDTDRRFFSPAFNIDSWVKPSSFDEMERHSQQQEISLFVLEDYEEALLRALTDAKDHCGARSIKCALAYGRSLKFVRPPRSEAEAAFVKAKSYPGPLAWADRAAPSDVFSDHMMHWVCHVAEKLNMTVQVHTGLQEGNGNQLTASDPMLLINLFREYPGTRFDIFHIGYPWHVQLAALAKNFQNVYIDMCWSHIISPNAAVEALSEYLDTVPLNKISAFGGDYSMIDPIIAHLEMAKENVARTLARKTEQGVFTLEQAKWVARKLFFENPATLFGVEGV